MILNMLLLSRVECGMKKKTLLLLYYIIITGIHAIYKHVKVT